MCAVDADEFHPVAGPTAIDVVVIADDGHGLGSLSVGYVLGEFLELDVLFVCELAEVVYDFEAIFDPAGGALGGLLHFGVIECHCQVRAAVGAPEKCHLHVGVYLRGADYYAAHRDEAVDVLGAEALEVGDLVEVLDADLQFVSAVFALGLVEF